MTTIVEPGATVIPFTDALLRTQRPERVEKERRAPDAAVPDNVVSLARFARRRRSAKPRHTNGGPPDGEAA